MIKEQLTKDISKLAIGYSSGGQLTTYESYDLAIKTLELYYKLINNENKDT